MYTNSEAQIGSYLRNAKYLPLHSTDHHSPPRLSIKLTLKDSSAVTLNQTVISALLFDIFARWRYQISTGSRERNKHLNM